MRQDSEASASCEQEVEVDISYACSYSAAGDMRESPTLLNLLRVKIRRRMTDIAHICKAES